MTKNVNTNLVLIDPKNAYDSVPLNKLCGVNAVYVILILEFNHKAYNNVSFIRLYPTTKVTT